MMERRPGAQSTGVDVQATRLLAEQSLRVSPEECVHWLHGTSCHFEVFSMLLSPAVRVRRNLGIY